MTKAPFRADHVGSLLRPAALHELREASSGKLKDAEDQAIREVVKLQEGIGLRSITDGEFRRRIWWSEFLLSLEGVEGSYRGEERFRDKTGHTVPAPRIDVTGKVRWR